MIDHTGLKVGNFAKAKEFYAAALAPLGYQVLFEADAATMGVDIAGLGVPPAMDFWLAGGGPNEPRIHVAFAAKDRAQVDSFYQAALAAGGAANGAPGLRPQYHPNYYGAFVLDPDGHDVEAVCHVPE